MLGVRSAGVPARSGSCVPPERPIGTVAAELTVPGSRRMERYSWAMAASTFKRAARRAGKDAASRPAMVAMAM
jgi:hypothetical protein